MRYSVTFCTDYPGRGWWVFDNRELSYLLGPFSTREWAMIEQDDLSNLQDAQP